MTRHLLIELTGTKGQIPWANDIRQRKFNAIAAFQEYNGLTGLTGIEQSLNTLRTIQSAKFWIQHREIPASAFLAYAYRKTDNSDGRMPIYYQRQSMKSNGVETLSKLVPLRFSFIGGKGGLKSSQIIKALPNVELHEIEGGEGVPKDVALKINSEGAKSRIIFAQESETGRDITVTPVISLMDGGWAVKEIDTVVVATYMQNDRISGANKAYVFERIAF